MTLKRLIPILITVAARCLSDVVRRRGSRGRTELVRLRDRGVGHGQAGDGGSQFSSYDTSAGATPGRLSSDGSAFDVTWSAWGDPGYGYGYGAPGGDGLPSPSGYAYGDPGGY